MKRKIMIRVSALLCAALLTGCAEVPSEVAQEIEILDHVSEAESRPAQEDSTASIAERGTLAALRAQAEQELAENHSRMVIESVRMPDSDDMPVCDVKIGGAPFETFSEICAVFFPDENTQPDNPVYQIQRGSDPIDEAVPAYDHPYWEGEHLKAPNVSFVDYITFYPHGLDKPYGLQWDTGYVRVSQTGWSEYAGYNGYVPSISDPPEERCRKKQPVKYTRAEALASDDRCEMVSGGEWAVADAVRYVEAVYNETLHKADVLDFTYTVHDVSALYIFEAEAYAYYFTVQFADAQGNPFDCGDTYVQRLIKSRIETGRSFPMELGSFAYCYGKEQLAVAEKSYTISEMTPTQTDPELLSVTAAAAVIDELLAPAQAIRIPCAELNYVLLCKGYPYTQQWEIETDPTGGFAAGYFPNLARRDCDFEIRPMWCFRSENYSDLDLNLGFVYMVDAVSGRLWILRTPSQMDQRDLTLYERIDAYTKGDDGT